MLASGNFHALILFTNDEEFQKVSECVHRLVYRALALDGTCESASFRIQSGASCYLQVLANMVLALGRRNISQTSWVKVR